MSTFYAHLSRPYTVSLKSFLTAAAGSTCREKKVLVLRPHFFLYRQQQYNNIFFYFFIQLQQHFFYLCFIFLFTFLFRFLFRFFFRITIYSFKHYTLFFFIPHSHHHLVSCAYIQLVVIYYSRFL